MTESDSDDNKPLPAHLIDYDPLCPSAEFTREQIDFIESVRADFSGEDLTALRKFEWFRLNLNWKQLGEPPLLGYGAVPGLRDGHDFGTLYVRRYSSEEYTKMMDRFLDYVPVGFPPKRVDRCRMPGIRVIVPNGDRYYPCVFRFDLDQWRKRLQGAADLHRTLLGKFDHGKFVLSDGQRFNFSTLKLDRLKTASYPKDW